MKTTVQCFALAAAILFAGTAQAHFAWLEFDKDTVQLRFSEGPGVETPAELQANIADMTIEAHIPMASTENFLAGSLCSTVNFVHGSYNYGVLDRSEQDRGVFMLKYHAKAARNLEDAMTKAGHAVEVFAEVKDGKMHVQVLHNGKPAPASELTISQEGADTDLEFDTDAEGRAAIPVGTEGWIGVRAMVREDTEGEHDGQAYSMIRHYATLTFPAK